MFVLVVKLNGFRATLCLIGPCVAINNKRVDLVVAQLHIIAFFQAVHNFRIVSVTKTQYV